MDGIETLQQIKKINPQLKVLILSGDIRNRKVKKMLNEGASGFIQKPFELSELSRIINKTLKNETFELQRECKSIF